MMDGSMKNPPAHVGELSNNAFAQLRKIIYDQSGISLNDGKAAMIKARVSKRLRRLELSGFDEYIQYLAADKSGEELSNLLDVVSTNVTSFFREGHHFEFLNSLIKNWMSMGQKKVRIWSCGCSSGEEPYSIAIELLEAAGTGKQRDFKILATDIASSVLKSCLHGEYDAADIAGIPAQRLNKYFDKSQKDNGNFYTAGSALKDMVLVRQFNMMSFPYPLRRQLDIIFCRNVMIYFDRPTKMRIIDEFHRLIKPGGYLFIGHAENLPDATAKFFTVRPTIYQRV